MKLSLSLVACLCASPWAAATRFQHVVVFTSEGQAAIRASAAPAVDGPDLPPDGMLGRLTHWDKDVFGCEEPLSLGDLAQFRGMKPVVLIERSTEDASTACTFEQKVLAAQAAGASGAIIYDYKDEDPVLMAYEHQAEAESPVTIPAVFVSHTVGVTLMNTVEEGSFPIVMLQAPAPPAWDLLALFEVETFTLGYCILAFLIFPLMVVHVVRMVRRRRRVEMAFAALKDTSEARTVVESRLPAWAKPLPLTMVEVRNTLGFKLYFFATLTLACFIFQVLLSQSKLEHQATHHKQQQPDMTNPNFVMDYSLGMVFSSITMAVAIMTILLLVRSCCKSRCTRTPPASVVRVEDGPTPEVSKGTYVTVQASEKDEPAVIVSTVAAVVVQDV